MLIYFNDIRLVRFLKKLRLGFYTFYTKKNSNNHVKILWFPGAHFQKTPPTACSQSKK